MLMTLSGHLRQYEHLTTKHLLVYTLYRNNHVFKCFRPIRYLKLIYISILKIAWLITNLQA